MEDTSEILEIVRPSSKRSDNPDDKMAEMHDVAQRMAKEKGKKMAVIKIPGGFEIRPAGKEDVAPHSLPLQKPEIQIVEEPPTQAEKGSSGIPWSNHFSKSGIQGGPGRHTRKG